MSSFSFSRFIKILFFIQIFLFSSLLIFLNRDCAKEVNESEVVFEVVIKVVFEVVFEVVFLRGIIGLLVPVVEHEVEERRE